MGRWTLGVRWGAIVFSGLMLAGQIIFALGTFAATYWLMLIGRLILGIGGELLFVAQNTYTVAW